MSKIKTERKPNPNARKICLPCRVNPDEMRKIIARAVRYSKGNISAFVRYAVLNYVPKKEETR